MACERDRQQRIAGTTAYSSDEGRIPAGAPVFTPGEQGDGLNLLYAGRVTALYGTPEGTVYRTMPRGASVRADVPTAAYRLSRTAMEEMEQHDPALASAFHRFIVRMLAARVDFANREIAGLQR